jgi:hypothetical protein
MNEGGVREIHRAIPIARHQGVNFGEFSMRESRKRQRPRIGRLGPDILRRRASRSKPALRFVETRQLYTSVFMYYTVGGGRRTRPRLPPTDRM